MKDNDFDNEFPDLGASNDLFKGGTIPPEALEGLKGSIRQRLITHLLFGFIKDSVSNLSVTEQKEKVTTMLTGFADIETKAFQEQIGVTAERIDASADDPITKVMNGLIEKTLLKAVQVSITETIKEMVDEILEIKSEPTEA